MRILFLALTLLAACQSTPKSKTVHIILGFGRVCCTTAYQGEYGYYMDCTGGTSIANAANFFDTGVACQERKVVNSGGEIDPGTVTLGN